MCKQLTQNTIKVSWIKVILVRLFLNFNSEGLSSSTFHIYKLCETNNFFPLNSEMAQLTVCLMSSPEREISLDIQLLIHSTTRNILIFGRQKNVT